MIEINAAILCASVPALKPLLSPRRLRKAFYDRRHGKELDLGPNLMELQTPCQDHGQKSRLDLDRDTFNLVQVTSESRTTAATHMNEYGVDLESPAPTLSKQEV